MTDAEFVERNISKGDAVEVQLLVKDRCQMHSSIWRRFEVEVVERTTNESRNGNVPPGCLTLTFVQRDLFLGDPEEITSLRLFVKDWWLRLDTCDSGIEFFPAGVRKVTSQEAQTWQSWYRQIYMMYSLLKDDATLGEFIEFLGIDAIVDRRILALQLAAEAQRVHPPLEVPGIQEPPTPRERALPPPEDVAEGHAHDHGVARRNPTRAVRRQTTDDADAPDVAAHPRVRRRRY
mmetsp:Transcript_10528/g.26401  ORF Transcript_10528/g.26401 Transcript_10528/m.26401 type:complete len:234 (+) Transcript_10528:791-1492(+)